MVRLELAEGKFGTTAHQDDVGAQVAGDAARRCDHSLMVSASEERRLTQTGPSHRDVMRKLGGDTRAPAVAMALR